MNKQKHKTGEGKKISLVVMLREIIEVYQEYNVSMPSEMRVGKNLYEELLTDAQRDVPKPAEKIHLESLWGVKVSIDSSLKPNEIKFK